LEGKADEREAFGRRRDPVAANVNTNEPSDFIREEGFIEYLKGYLLLKNDYAPYVTNRLNAAFYIAV
jgi:hypothetical protein